jgi:CRISPR-associated endonuclease/helicase Cas3
MVALHDIGKIAAVFQGQRTTPQARHQRERLEREAFVFGPRGPDHPPPHNAISALFVHDHLRELMPDTQQTLIKALRDAAGGHHGFFVDDLEQVREALVDEPVEWHTLRCQGFELLRAQLAPAELLLTEVGAPRRLRTATITLTGLIVLSDWIGSNTAFFAPDCETPLHEYIEKSRDSARNAVIKIGFGATRQPPTYSDFAALFPELDADRPLPQALDALDEADLAGPALYVIEAPAGEGKTEVALALARRLAAGGLSDENFFALPTMATGNQMFARLSTFYDNLYGRHGAVKLVHGQAALIEDELRRATFAITTHCDSGAAGQAGEPHWTASGDQVLRWFGTSKRALLAPFGTGTVDQVELAGLHARYYMLRLFSLANKVVIVDEIHAYDTYMSTILERTLCWLGALNTSVILLSATLPARRHAQLATHFLRGVTGDDALEASVPADLVYPSLSIYTPRVQRRLQPAAFRPAQQLELQWVHDTKVENEARRLVELVAEGGAVARICNRVDDAQAIMRALKDLAAKGTLLIHARYPLEQRQRLESQVDTAVGRDSTRTVGQRIIVVGTQVLEQSLDYDVDVMISDFAPIDLLLQRAGRLHRHNRPRAPRHRRARLYVQVALDSRGFPDFARWQRIYDAWVLWQTWLVLDQRLTKGVIPITLPDDYRPLIEAVYTGEPWPAPAEAAWAQEVEAAWTRMREREASMAGEARLRLAPDPLLRDPIMWGGNLKFIEDEDGAVARWQAAKTRLGDRVTAVPLYKLDDGLALDSAGKHLLMHAQPDIETQNELLKHSLPISDGRLIKALRTTARWPWRETPSLLRYVYPLILDADGTTILAGVTIRLDPVLGLVINEEEV